MHDLLSALTGVYRDRSAIDSVRVSGKTGWFRDLVEKLLESWGIEGFSLGKGQRRWSTREIMIPDTNQRTRDLPIVIAYFTQEYARRCAPGNSQWKNPVKSISHPLLWFMLTYDNWRDFENLRAFVEGSLSAASEEVLTLHGALATSHRSLQVLPGFVRDTASKHTGRPEETQEIITFLSTVGSWRSSWNWLVAGYLGLPNDETTKRYAETAPLATLVSKVGQAMDNIHALMNVPATEDEITEDDRTRLNDYFALIRQKKAVADMYAKLGFQTQGPFEDWARNRHVDIEFEQDDTISTDWTQARDQLLPGREDLASKADATPPGIAKEYPKDKRVLDRKDVDERVHWFVNGVDKGPFFVRPSANKAKIIEALYGQIGLGWVPHKTFMDACGWKEQEYYPSFDNPGRMQRQLTHIRKFLGVKIEFRKDKGVRFAENVVKSK